MVNDLAPSEPAPYAPDHLPTPILAKIISHSDPSKWYALGNPSVCAITNLTTFRREWVCNLFCAAHIPLRPKSTDDIIHTAAVVLDPVTDLVGSDTWLSGNFIHALNRHHPNIFAALAPCLVWALLNAQKPELASTVTACSRFDLCMFNGLFVRKLLEDLPHVWMLEWLENNGLDIRQQEKCFSMSVLTSWTMNSRVDLLGFLAQRNINLPTRSLLEYALSHSSPETVEFLVISGAGNQSRVSWNDLLMMACTDAKARLDVFQHIISNTEPSIVWTFAACCIASHAMIDTSAYTKFSALRNSVDAEQWLIRSLRGRTPIECICERLTFESMPYVSPFIKDYIELGVSTTGMPSIVAMLCQ